MLAYTRKETHELNEMARTLRHALGELGQDHAFMTAKGNRKGEVGENLRKFVRRSNIIGS